MRGCPSTHPAARVPRGVGWLGIPNLRGGALLYRVRVRAMDCSRVRPFLSPHLLLSSLASLAALARAACGLLSALLALLAGVCSGTLSCALAFFAPTCSHLLRLPDTPGVLPWVTLASPLILHGSLRSLLGITPLAQSAQRSFITSYPPYSDTLNN